MSDEFSLINRYFAPYWKKALKAAGLDESIRFHDLRHHAGTSAATAGASLREIMARMGHASSDASLRYLKASARRDAEIHQMVWSHWSIQHTHFKNPEGKIFTLSPWPIHSSSTALPPRMDWIRARAVEVFFQEPSC